MNLFFRVVPLALAGFLSSVAVAQQTQNTVTPAVPNLIRFAGSYHPAAGRPRGPIGATFAIYNEQEGGTPLWSEDRNVELDANGNYSVLLGSAKNEGVPPQLFATGESRWLQVKLYVPNEVDLPRVLLVSVPYAMKAGDAATVGGLPPSAFVLAAPPTANPETLKPSGASATPNLAGSGTQDYIPLWVDSSGTLGNSALYQSGTGATARIGVNITTPATTLDVAGAGTIRGSLTLPPVGTATATTGYKSQPLSLTASVFGDGAPVKQIFQWRAEPVGNYSASASGSLNLLYASGSGTPAETGFSVDSSGDLTLKGNLTLGGNLLWPATSTPLIWNSSLGNNFSAGLATLPPATTGFSDTAVGDLALGSNTIGATNTAIGFEALSRNTTGYANTASGGSALGMNTSGSNNTADGVAALSGNAAGSNNTAVGTDALISNGANNNTAIGSSAGVPAYQMGLTGSNDTFLGANTGPGSQTAVTNATAVGANAEVTESNALVLGSINGLNGAAASTSVGIGTTAPAYTLDVHGTANFTAPVTFAAGQTFPGMGTVTSVTAGTGLAASPNPITTSGTLSIASNACASGNALSALPFTCSPFATLGANTFTGNQTVNGNLSATGVVTGNSFGIGSNLFAFGSYSVGNAFLGFSGNTTTTGEYNTASGYQALLSNTDGSYNTAIGSAALLNNLGLANTAIGFEALENNVSGNLNVALGAYAGSISGSGNIALGAYAGSNVSNSNNIDIGNEGAASDNGTIRIGTTNAVATYIGGIYGENVGGVPVYINSNGQLGTVSSSRRYKEDIQDMADASNGLMRLRPVTFRYKKPFDDGSKPVQYGLIAEEVAEIYPDLVARSADGQIETIKYQLLTPMLLNEIQKQKEQIRTLEERLARVEAALSGTTVAAPAKLISGR